MRVHWLLVFLLGASNLFGCNGEGVLVDGIDAEERNLTNEHTGSVIRNFASLPYSNVRCNENFTREHLIEEQRANIEEEEPVELPMVKRMEYTPSSSGEVNWITQVISVLSPLPDDLGTKCRRDTEIYLRELNNFTDWAVRMMDASGKLPHGILMGNIRSMGDFDECLWAKPTEDVQPQYCLATVYNFHVKDTYPKYEKLQHIVKTMTMNRMNLETTESVMGVLPMQRSARIEWAMCIPASCRPADVETMLKSAGQRLFSGSDIRLSVHEKDCYTNAPRSEFSLRDRLIVLSIASILVLVVIGTLRDQPDGNNNETEEEKPLVVKILDAFSLKRSWAQLTDFPQVSSGKQIDCLDGLRGISSLWVAMGHMALLAASSPYYDKVTFFNTQDYPIMMLFWNFFLPVDTFLVIGGLVRAYTLIPGLDRGTVNHWKNAATRYLRLTPALLVVIGFYLAILDRVASGPLWNRHVGLNKLSCEWNWWKTIFYVNNYIGPGDEGYHMCMLQSWYTAMDMQFYLLAPLIIIPMWRYPKLGALLLATVAAVATLTQYATIGKYVLPALPVTMHSSDSAVLSYARRLYFVSHNRVMPYLIGIATGYITYYHKNVQMPQAVAAMGWSLATVALIWPLFGAQGYLDVAYPLGGWEHGYFGTFHKSVWSMGISWVIFACHNGYGGGVNSFLSSNVLKFFARISYSVFLAHLGVLICLTGYMRTPKHTDLPSIVKDVISDISLVIATSVMLHLLVEAPFSQLVSLVFKKTTKEPKKAR